MLPVILVSGGDEGIHVEKKTKAVFKNKFAADSFLKTIQVESVGNPEKISIGYTERTGHKTNVKFFEIALYFLAKPNSTSNIHPYPFHNPTVLWLIPPTKVESFLRHVLHNFNEMLHQSLICTAPITLRRK
jgi:hypothetical protein